ncbi:MAG: hypothetical protein GTN86_00985 [Xanthomonadales bacterium]|nr:hypothetical protein [Xanthomonadales bacterium]NIN58389.1 hypothetical protein [Xanthomonadales bacterium]NIN73726.1 hypothetical protein [Xanthomonadales bacterium]NIO14524.1 hypothetical protein [Xanthomonadales bacterium]NIP10782.1 hypothetical protein [Xanthomonadales bacterium]
MQCTPNELLALLKRALDALPGHRLDADAVARNVVELEVLGLSGVHPSLALFNDDRNTRAQGPAIIHDDGVVHMADGSLLAWAPQVIDLAICQVDHTATVTLSIDSARDPLGLLPELIRSDRTRWRSAELSWPEDQDGHRCVLWLEADAVDPWLGRLDGPMAEAGRPKNPVSLMLARAGAGPALPKPPGVRWRITPDAFASRRHRALIRGLEIDDHDWDILNRLADRVLVESSDRSRKGAGE